MGFDEDLPIGELAEELARKALEDYLGYPVRHDSKKTHDLMTDRGERIEVKYDRKWQDTGNVAVEYKCRDKLSGLAVTKADWWVQVLGADVYICRTEELKQHLKTHKYPQVTGGDDKKSDLILLPLQQFYLLFNNITMAKLNYLNKIDPEKLPAIINIKVKKIFEAKQDNYGNIKKCCVVDYNGTEYYADFKEKDFQLLTEGGVLSAVKKFYKDNLYFEFYEGATSSEATKSVYNKTATEIIAESGGVMKQDATQERILKGMCFNNACTLFYAKNGMRDIGFGDVLKLSKDLYNEMKDWLIS